MPRPYTGFTLGTSSTPSVSTNATEDNRPGPGRTLGLLYKHFGRRIEGPINRFAASRRPAARATIGRTRSSTELSDSSSSSVSTNATADDNIGPGRVLGLLFDHLGRKLEALINRTAIEGGLGPDAAHDRIQQRIKTEDELLWQEWSQHKERGGIEGSPMHDHYRGRRRRLVQCLLEKRETVKDCHRPIEYAQYVSSLSA